MAYLNWLADHFWDIFLAAILVSMFFGDTIRDTFYAIIGLGERRGLSRKQQRRLRQETDEAKHALTVAVDILRDVQAADRAFPQLPQDARMRTDAFLAEHLKRPALEQPGKTRGQNAK